MTFLDILFPVNLDPLTYLCPDGLADSVIPGMIVNAPLKNRITKGIVVKKNYEGQPDGIKTIRDIYHNTPVMSGRMIELLEWMARYYMTKQGIVLKNILPEEVFTPVKQRITKAASGLIPDRVHEQLAEVEPSDQNATALLSASLSAKIFRTFLFHAPTTRCEHALPLNVLAGTGDAIVLVPEVTYIDTLLPLFRKSFGERVCAFHGGLSRGKKTEVIGRILSGKSDIIIGTRSAVFAPLKKVSFIGVLHEHNRAYKQEGSLLYNGRDIAVMRGFLEGATVLLSSVCPSVESFYNCRKGKYNLIKPSVHEKRPAVRIADMRYQKLLKPGLSKEVMNASLRHVRDGEKVMFVINRRGHSTVLQCAECDYVEECPGCRIPLVLHKAGNAHEVQMMKCHYCGYATAVPSNCGRCKGYNLKQFGTGTQKVQEEIESITGIRTIRFDSDSARKQSELRDLPAVACSGENRIIIGTKLMTGRVGGRGGFSMGAILNADLSLNVPDFRSAESAFQEMASILDLLEPGGELLIQTRIPQHYVFRALKDNNYAFFFREEMARRRALLYPPYSRIILVKLICKKDISDLLSDFMGEIAGDVMVLGPSMSKNKKGGNLFRVLLKSSNREHLHSAAGHFLDKFKGAKDVSVRVDVDPIAMQDGAC
jgi:primosomal protein N' (replication factor Y)